MSVADNGRVPAGTWVAIERVILRPGERAPGIPPETAAQPLTALVKGFLLAPAALGEQAGIRTMAGREVEGVLKEANPAYTHGFGGVVPELLRVGEEARERLRGFAAPVSGSRAEDGK